MQPTGRLCGSVLDVAHFVHNQHSDASAVLSLTSRQAMYLQSAQGLAGSPSTGVGVALGGETGESRLGCFLL